MRGKALLKKRLIECLRSLINIDIRQKHKILNDSESGGALHGATLLSLSLFIILLAFFIVLNAISNFSEQKVDAAFDSLDLAFATELIPSQFEKQSDDTREEKQDGAGDSLEDIQAVLRSVLPGLNVDLTENPNGGKVMALQIKKDKFERLSVQLLPVLIRILNVKDGVGEYDLSLSSYVRNTLSRGAEQSFDTIKGYKQAMIEKGMKSERILLSVEKGNPAYLVFRFEKGMRR